MGCASGAGRLSGTRARLRDGRNTGPQPKPPWLKVKVRYGENFLELRRLMREHGLHTVCEESGPCPNIYECWEQRTATFLILGNVCTRRCTFCDVITGSPPELDLEEPERVAKAVAAVGLEYAVVTGVARDDIRSDGGASIWADTIRAIRRHNPDCGVEVLTPDFRAMPHAIRTVVDAEARCLRAQSRDGSPVCTPRAQRLLLRSVARGTSAGEVLPPRSGHEGWSDPGDGGDERRGARGTRGPPRGRRRSRDDGPVPVALALASGCRSIRSTLRSSTSSATMRAHSDSVT